MNLLGWWRPSAASGGDGDGRGETDDFWYTPLGPMSSSGILVTHQTAVALTTLLACVKAISETIGALPLRMFEKQPNGDKRMRDRHPIADLLHLQANDEQSAAEWRETVLAWALMRGTAVSEIIPGRRGAVDQLVPLHPDYLRAVKVRDLQGRTRWQFEFSEPGAPTRRLLRDEVFIVRGLSLGPDNVLGMDPIRAEANSIGAALAAADYAGRFFANDARPSAVLEHPGHFRDEGSRNVFRRAWERLFTGRGRHRTAVLEYGMKYQAISVTPEQAQFLETRKYQDTDICRIFRVPPHKVGILDRATFSNIEQQALEFVSDTLQPWLVRFEQSIYRDLIIAKDRFFAEHNVAGLLRGDLRSRYEAFAIGRNWGWLSVNEIRRIENMNSIGEDGDVYLQPLNMVPAGEPGEPSGQTQRQRDQEQPEPRREPAAARAMKMNGKGLWLPSSTLH